VDGVVSKQFDLAQELEEKHRVKSLAVQAAAAATKEQPLVIDGVRVCLDCRDPIGKKRLKAKPDAARCVECQELKEKQNRRKR
jgi:DnaK suppressor protein